MKLALIALTVLFSASMTMPAMAQTRRPPPEPIPLPGTPPFPDSETSPEPTPTPQPQPDNTDHRPTGPASPRPTGPVPGPAPLPGPVYTTPSTVEPRPDYRPAPVPTPTRPDNRPIPQPDVRPIPRPDVRPIPQPDMRPIPQTDSRPLIPNRYSPRSEMRRWRVSYRNPDAYYARIRREHIVAGWAQEPSRVNSPGMVITGSYPWMVHAGIRYRYNPKEKCRYDLVDREGLRLEIGMNEGDCDVTYDRCAEHRERLNYQWRSQRFFCAERVGTRYANRGETRYSPLPPRTEERRGDRREPLIPVNRSMIEGYRRTYNDAVLGRMGQCRVLSGAIHGTDCRYSVWVGRNRYAGNLNVCSTPESARAINCNVSTDQQVVAGCIVSHAAMNRACY